MSSTPPTPARRASLLAAGAMAAATLVSSPLLTSSAAAATPAPVTEIAWAGEAGGAFGTGLGRTACDVDGDGRDDVVVGDWGWDRPGYANTGAGYVLLGGDELAGGDVADFDAARTRRIEGPSVTITGGAWVGWSASCLGDVNGDGIEDLALGSGSRTYQSVHVILGDRDLQSIDLDHLGTRGFVIEDPGANVTADDQGEPVLDGATDNFGHAVGAVGDVNGDGLADIGIVDLLSDRNGRTNSGRVWVVAGSRSVRNVDVSTDAERVLFTVDGAAGNDRLGTVSGAGDVNGDGVDDFMMSSYTATPWGASAPVAGAAYVVHGRAGTAAQLDLAALGDHGFAIRGPVRGRDRLGMSVAPAGDVDRDGLADVVVGADGVSATGAPRSGGAAVVLGSASTATVLTDPTSTGSTVLACPDGATDPACAGATRRGYWIDGESDGGKAGFSVGSTADVNGDGSPETLIGAQSGSRGAWLVHGSATADRLSLAALPAGAGQLLGTGRPASIGTAGDLDGNGVDDVVAGGGNAVSAYLLGALSTRTTISGPAGGTVGTGVDFSAVVRSPLRSRAGDLSGTLTFTVDGTPVTGCVDLPVTDGSALDCAVPAGTRTGRHVVAAAFTPAGDSFTGSAASADLEVTKAEGQVPTLALSSTEVGYGAAPVRVTVTMEHTLSGDVEVLVDGVGVGRVTSHHGGAVLTLPRSLAVGRHHVSARYLGDASHEPSGASTPAVLTVRKAALATAPRVTVRRGKPPVVRVVLGRLDNGELATGPVRLQVGQVTRTVQVRPAQQGRVRVTLPRRTRSGAVVRVRYLGTATTASAPVVKVRLR